MNQTTEKTIEYYENNLLVDEKGEVIHHPLEGLYYWKKGKDPHNLNHLSFAGDYLYRSTSLSDVRALFLEFHAEKYEEMDREAWADPLRADVLKRLAGTDRSWYISLVSYSTKQMINNDKRITPDAITSYIAQKDSAEVAIIDSRKPYGYGLGTEKRLFFEVPYHEIEWFVRNLWAEAYQGYSIEGYNFESERMDILKNWNEKLRDDLLFREVIDRSFAIFYSYPEEHRHFAFLTNKFDSSEFSQRIDIEELRKKAKDL